MKIMHYDRTVNGAERLLRNSRSIMDVAPKGLGLMIDEYSRLSRFDSKPGAADVLFDRPFPYKVVVINLQGRDAEEVYIAAILNMDDAGIPFNRLIVLGCHQLPPPAQGHYVVAHGGDGYLLPEDAKEVIRLLSELNW